MSGQIPSGGSGLAPVMQAASVQAAPAVMSSVRAPGPVSYVQHPGNAVYGGGSVISNGGSVYAPQYAAAPQYGAPGFGGYGGIGAGFAPFPTTLGTLNLQPITGFASLQAPVAQSVSVPVGASVGAPLASQSFIGASVAAPFGSSAAYPPIIQHQVSASATAPVMFAQSAVPTFPAPAPIQSSSIRYAAPMGWGAGGSVTVPHAGSVVLPM